MQAKPNRMNESQIRQERGGGGYPWVTQGVTPLLLDLDTAPESDVSLDVSRRGLGVGIVPGRVRVLLPVDQQAVIPGLSLPRTRRCCRAGSQLLPLYGTLWKIEISLNCFNLIAFRQNLAVPDCLCHRVKPFVVAVPK